MSINQILPFISTAIMLGFTIYVFQRYFVRHAPHFLFWGIGLAMFGLGSFAEVYLSLAWSPAVFVMWYLFGAILNPAWIGQGTLYLLVRKSWVHIVSGILILASFASAALMLSIPINASGFHLGIPISQQYKVIIPPDSFNLISHPDHYFWNRWTCFVGGWSALFGVLVLAQTRA